MPRCLSLLPKEVLDTIVRFSSATPGRLFYFSLTSRQLNRVATPHLYAELCFNDATPEFGTPWLPRLTETLLRKPYLAALVRSLSIRKVLVARPGRKANWPKRSATAAYERKEWSFTWLAVMSLEAVLRPHLRALTASDEEAAMWSNNVVHRNKDAILALLLPNLPSPERLDLLVADISFHYLPIILDRATKKEAPFNKRPTFSKFKHILLPQGHYLSRNSSRTLCMFLTVPTVRSIHAWTVDMTKQPIGLEGLKAIAPGKSNVEVLELRNSHFHYDDLRNLLFALI